MSKRKKNEGVLPHTMTWMDPQGQVRQAVTKGWGLGDSRGKEVRGKEVKREPPKS
jgi:hypothetical protein